MTPYGFILNEKDNHCNQAVAYVGAFPTRDSPGNRCLASSFRTMFCQWYGQE
jgi:hypothetical protein